jgi:hypothetical protein
VPVSRKPGTQQSSTVWKVRFPPDTYSLFELALDAQTAAFRSLKAQTLSAKGQFVNVHVVSRGQAHSQAADLCQDELSGWRFPSMLEENHSSGTVTGPKSG